MRHLREMDEWIRVYDPRFWDPDPGAVPRFRQPPYFRHPQVLESGNFREAGESAHALKGLCLMLGLRRMGESCKSLESACAQGGKDGNTHFRDLEDFLEPSLAEMRKQVGQA